MSHPEYAALGAIDPGLANDRFNAMSNAQGRSGVADELETAVVRLETLNAELVGLAMRVSGPQPIQGGQTGIKDTAGVARPSLRTLVSRLNNAIDQAAIQVMDVSRAI